MIEAQPAKPWPLPDRVRAVVLDWAGTTVDFGSRAPVAAVLAAFELAGVPVSEEQARRPMGRAKRDHLAEMLQDPDVAERWATLKGHAAGDADVDVIYHDFLRLQAGVVAEHSRVIDGCLESVAWCRSAGIGVGSSTGYTRDLLDRVAERARAEGYEPDVRLSCDDVSPGRPAPWLCMENARRLGVYPMAAVVKFDDTPTGIAAGRNAGAWCVGMVASGNEVGLARHELASLADVQRERLLAQARQRLFDAGAHLLIDTIAELPAAVQRVNERLAAGESP